DPAKVDDLVEVRLRRQEVLTRDDYPASIDTVIDEAALRRVVGSRQIMRDQLEQLLESSTESNVTLRVLPFTAGAHRALAEGTFPYFKFRRDIDSDVVNIEGHITDNYAEGDQVKPYRALLSDLRGRALSPSETRRFIAEISHEFRKEE